MTTPYVVMHTSERCTDPLCPENTDYSLVVAANKFLEGTRWSRAAKRGDLDLRHRATEVLRDDLSRHPICEGENRFYMHADRKSTRLNSSH